MCQLRVSSAFPTEASLRLSDETNHHGAQKNHAGAATQIPREFKFTRSAGHHCPRPINVGFVPQKLSHTGVPPSSTSSCPIRSRFLRRIGIGARIASTPVASVERPSAVALREPLKDLPGKAADGGKGRSSVTFAPFAAVRLIPRRDDYSERVRKQLWSARSEMYANITRNAIEFASENWDWRMCVEEGNMFVCTATGEHIHPVHLSRYETMCRVQYVQYRQNLRSPFLQKSRSAAQRWSHS